MNIKEYRCNTFDVGADSISAQKNINNANTVGACIACPQKQQQKGITLIALIITIIIMLILAGVVLSLTIGEHGIFKTAEDAVKKYSEAEAQEKISLIITDLQAKAIINGKELTLEDLKSLTDVNSENYNSDITYVKIDGDNAFITIGNTTIIVNNNFEISGNSNQTGGAGAVEEPGVLNEISKINTPGKYDITIEDKTYPVHLYVYNGNQTWNTDMTFGDAEDVGKGVEDATGKIVAQEATRTVMVKIKGNLEIKDGVTVTAYANEEGYGGPKGMFIYVEGDLVNNGRISMTKRGAYAKGEDVYLFKNEDETYEMIPASGANGGASQRGGKNTNKVGNNGENAIGRQTGGGGSGGIYQGDSSSASTYYSGAGSKGTSYSGGTGGGGTGVNYPSSGSAETGAAKGGKGGNALGTNYGGWATRAAGGGAGNPGGEGMRAGTLSYTIGKGENGTGGLLVIFANNIANNGQIDSNGSKGANYDGYNYGGGGSSGGGSINIFLKGTLSQKGTIEANGGESCVQGSTGGNGSITIGNISTGTFVKDEVNSTN